MSARFTTGANQFNRTTNLLDYTSTYTYMFWYYVTSNTGGDQTGAAINSNSLSNFDLCGNKSNLATRFAVRSNSGTNNDLTGTILTVGTWYHFAMRRNSSTSAELLLDGVVDITNNQSTASRGAVNAQHVGEQVGGFASLDGRIAAIKEFNTNLTTAEINAERFTYLPKIADSRLINWTPCLIGSRLKALRGVDWSETGTVTDEFGPPISWGGGAVILPFIPVSGTTAVTTGTAIPDATEVEIVAGGETIILTLTGDTWVAAGATFNAQRQNIIDGLDSAQSELTGWNNEVRDKEVVTAVVRTSATVVTITLTASAAYDITAQETVTCTIPAAALVTSASAVVAVPTFAVNFTVATGTFTNYYYQGLMAGR